jgi:RNA polymerase primary sigma factor
MLHVEVVRMDKHDPNDPVAVYLREVANVMPLTKNEETELFRQLGHRRDSSEREGDPARRLIESQLALVVNIAQANSGTGVPMLELIQEGNIGLMNAVRSFAEKPVGDFTAHASACIEDAIAKAIGRSK